MKTAMIAIVIMGLSSPLALADDSKKDYKSKAYGKIKMIKNQIDANTANIQSLTTRVDNLPVGGGGTTPTPPGADPQVQVNTTAISNLNTQVQTNTNNISSNAAQIQGNTGNINGVSAEAQANTALNAMQTTQIQANAAANAAQDTLIQNNTTTNAAQTTLIQTNATAVTDLTTNSQAMQGNVDSLTGQVGTIQSDLNVQGTQVQANTDNVANNTARITALESGGGGGGTPPPPPPAEPPATPAIDFTRYIPNAATKDFRFINNGACNTVNQTITRVDDATGSDITISETPTGLLGDCTTVNSGYRLTATHFSIMSYMDTRSNINFTYPAPGGNMLNSSMEVGKTFGFALSTTNSQMSATIQKNTILSIEPSVTVLAGTFTNCLKMLNMSSSSITFTPKVEQVSWLCEGIGEVKRLSVGSLNEMSVMELRSFTR